jgi:glucuronoarabinoxylan endo-1,4-beta-xylanase
MEIRKNWATGITVVTAILTLLLFGCPQATNDSGETGGLKAAAPVIAVQPGDYQPAIHEAVNLNVTASVSDNGELSYQWYNAVSVGGTGNAIAGAVESAYSPPTDSAGISYYYAEVSNSVSGTKTTTKSRYATVYVVDSAAVGLPAGGLNIQVDTGSKHQFVRGFGGMMNNWTSPDVTINDADTLFNPDKLGFNILRMEITPEPLEEIMDGTVFPSIDNSDLFDIGKLVNRYGGMIIGCPWTPPDGLKLANGHLDPSHYTDMADHLISWVKKMETGMGGDNKIYAISVQNEPNESPSWCNYTAEENLAFVKQQGPRIHAELPHVKLFPGEHSGFVQSFYQPILDDSEALALVDGFAGHFYGGSVGQKKQWAIDVGKEVWMTEHYYNTGSNYNADPTWNNLWTIARDFHNCMINDYNAYVMWYAKRFYCLIGDSQPGVTNQRNGVPNLRGYLMSHYAKYASGRTRVDANWVGDDFTTGASTPSNVYASAYEDDTTITLVMFNTATTNPTGNEWINIKLPTAVSTVFAVATYNKGNPAPALSALAESTAKMEPTPVVLDTGKTIASVKLPPSTIVSIKVYK